MSEMVELVAKAIYEKWASNRSVSEPWDEVSRLGHSISEEAREEARAAIEVMGAEIERLQMENWQLRQACGYPIPNVTAEQKFSG